MDEGLTSTLFDGQGRRRVAFTTVPLVTSANFSGTSNVRVDVQTLNSAQTANVFLSSSTGVFLSATKKVSPLSLVGPAFPNVQNFIIGNEPNLNLFWQPQFGAGGRDLAAPSYELLLAKTYDALKSFSPTVNVIGGALSPRGQDKPTAARQTHSPTALVPAASEARIEAMSAFLDAPISASNAFIICSQPLIVTPPSRAILRPTRSLAWMPVVPS